MRTLHSAHVRICLLSLVACAAQRANSGAGHGQLTTLSVRGTDARFCRHQVPEEVCTRCRPELAAGFKAAKDWCEPHGIPESQCFECHPDLSFEPLPELPAAADVKRISHTGEDFGELRQHVTPGKVTIVDFYADWCAACRKIDVHVFAQLKRRSDLALRKVNIVDWDTPVAKRHLEGVERLPYVLVFGKKGKLVRAVTGVDLDVLDRAITEGARQ